ncbi:MAG: carboxypeptidase regulatory-like domain-containing protein [Planctomycetota bacterium]
MEDGPPSEQAIRSTADGAFRIPTVAAGAYVEVRASAPGYVVQPTYVVAGEDGALATVQATGARWLAVRVERDGRPASGATVSIGLNDRAVVGPTGEVVAGPLLRRDLIVEVRDPEAAGPVRERVVADDDRLVRISTQPGLDITGTLFEESGRPAADVLLSALRGERLSRWRSTTTAEDGSFRLRGLAPGTWSLSAQGENERGAWDIAAGSQDVRLALAPPEAASRPTELRVRGPGGGDVARARLMWATPNQGGGGGFWVPGATLGGGAGWTSEGLRVEILDARDPSGAPLPYGPAIVGPMPAGSSAVDVVLPPGRTLHGRALTATGDPVSGLRVLAQARSQLDESQVVMAEAVTATDGEFAFVSLGTTEVDLVVSARSNDRWGLVAPVRARPDGPPALLALVARSDVSVRVLSAAGRPAAEVRVRATRRPGKTEESHVATTDADGLAVLADVVPGATYELTIHATSDQGADLRHATWKAADCVVRLEPWLTIQGDVRDDAGLAYVGALVLIRGEGSGWGLAVADEGGRFVADVRTDSKLRLLAVPPWNPWGGEFCEWGLAAGPVEARPGQDVSLVVKRGVRPELVVEDFRPEAWEGSQLSLTRLDAEDPELGTASGRVADVESARVRLPPLERGARYAAYLSPSEDERCALTVFTAEETGVVTLTPRAARTIAGRVRGAPLGHTIKVRARELPWISAVPADAEGGFVLAGVPAGARVELEATCEVEGRLWRGTTTATPGEHVVVEATAQLPREAAKQVR